MRLFFILFLGLLSFEAQPCTTMVLTDKHGLTVAKNIDWPIREGLLVIHPRHVEYTAKTDATHAQPMHWQSQYGSVIFHGNDHGKPGPAVDGMNERGLTASIMVLPGSKYPSNTQNPQLNIGRWSQYILDNFESVEEVIDHINDYELWPESYHGYLLKFHLYINDQSGHSAIIEYSEGKALVYQDTEINPKALTNSFYHYSMEHLKEFKRFGGIKTLPGEYDSLSRFVKACAYLKKLPDFNDQEKIAYAFSGLGIAAQPIGEPSPTQISLFFDITNKTIYYRTVNHANIRKVNMATVNFDELNHEIISNPFG